MKALIHGFDTLEVCYYLRPSKGCQLDFENLAMIKDAMRNSKTRDPIPITLGSTDFLLSSHGTARGYPFLIANSECSIEFGEFNHPSFFVTFRSIALWHKGIQRLHAEFLAWVQNLGLYIYQEETLTRVDFTFDYHLPEVDFDEDSFVSLAAKDCQYRKDGKVQTFKFGESDVVLRFYNKIDEIHESSQKTWMFPLWGVEENVWRIEWQVRKDPLRRFGIRTLQDLQDGAGDILRYLAGEHDTLRIQSSDSNKSRWPLHPLWLDVQAQIRSFNAQGVYRELDGAAIIDERLTRMAISVYGYLKRVGAIQSLQTDASDISFQQAFSKLQSMVASVHDPLSWKVDVQKRASQMRLGQW